MTNLHISLTFDKELTEKLIQTSEDFNKKVPSKYILGEKSIPHISLVRTHIPISEKNTVIEKLRPYLGKQITFKFRGQYYDPDYRKNRGIYHGIHVTFNSETRALQEKLRQILEQDSNRIETFPHVTIGLIPFQEQTPDLPFQSDLIQQEFTGKITLGTTDGTIGQLIEIY